MGWGCVQGGRVSLPDRRWRLTANSKERHSFCSSNVVCRQGCAGGALPAPGCLTGSAAVSMWCVCVCACVRACARARGHGGHAQAGSCQGHLLRPLSSGSGAPWLREVEVFEQQARAFATFHMPICGSAAQQHGAAKQHSTAAQHCSTAGARQQLVRTAWQQLERAQGGGRAVHFGPCERVCHVDTSSGLATAGQAALAAHRELSAGKGARQQAQACVPVCTRRRGSARGREPASDGGCASVHKAVS